jgi:hypothetical protein
LGGRKRGREREIGERGGRGEVEVERGEWGREVDDD